MAQDNNSLINREHADDLNAYTIEKEIKSIELELKRLELSKASREIRFSVIIPLVSGLVIALIGVVSSVAVTYINGNKQHALEEYKAEVSLILEAAKTGANNPSAAQRNLLFFVDAGLLKDKRIVTLIRQGRTPVLPASSGPSPARGFTEIDRNIGHLHPLFREKVQEVLNSLKDEGIPIQLFEGFRSPHIQQLLYNQGRNTDQPIATDAQPWLSLRQYGFAASFAIHQYGVWVWDDNEEKRSWWQRLRQIASDEGLELISTDQANFRLPGISVYDLHQGRYPPGGDDTWAENLRNAIQSWTGQPPSPPLP
jgi:hypothetical protein